MAVNLTTADSALKTYYLNAVSEQLNNCVNPFYAKIKHCTENVWGKDVRKLAISGINGGIGAGSEDGNLPTSSSNNYCELVTTLKNIYGTIEISDKAIRASENNSGAFVNLLNSEMEGLVKSGTINMSRMLFGDGSGKLASTADILDGVINVSWGYNLFQGMVVDLYDMYDKPIENFQGRTINYVDRVRGKVILSGSTPTTNEIPYESYMVLQGSHNNEITGLKAIFDSTRKTIYGLSKEKHSFLNPLEINVGGCFTPIKLQEAIDNIEKVSGGQVDMILCSFDSRRKLLEMLSDKRMFVENQVFDGGFKTLSFNGIPIYADRFCPEQTIYLLNTKDFTLNQLCDWQWLEDDNGRILKQKPGKPVYTATLVKYAELLCSNPSGQCVLTNVF